MKNRPYAWVPTLYFSEAVPYMAVMTLSVIMYTQLGLSNTDLALYTGWLYLPWVIKPLWSPLVDSIRTKRWWIIAMQLLVGGALAAVALTLRCDWWLKGSLAFFWLMAFSSATHDIAADGFYILGLDERQQALYVGIRSTAYRVGMIFCQGFIVMLAGWLESSQGVSLAWTITMALMGGVMLMMGAWHAAVVPRVEDEKVKNENTETQAWDEKVKNIETQSQAWGEKVRNQDIDTYVRDEKQTVQNTELKAESDETEAAPQSCSQLSTLFSSFALTITTFARKPHIWTALLFMLLFRFPEAQLAKMAQPFMLRPLEQGGLALDTVDVGIIYGTVGVVALLLGGIVGGIVVARHGLKRWWWPMVMAISIPDLVYIYFAVCQPTSVIPVYAGVALEQLGYGFGFTAYSLFLVYFSRGERSTSVFSLCTALQALGMMLPGMVAGWLADVMGFSGFFVWVAGCCLVTFLVSAFCHVPEAEGKAK